MKVWFRIRSQVLEVDQILNAVRLPYERINRIGEPLNAVSNKKHDWNRVSFFISETNSFKKLNEGITRTINESVVDFNEIKESYKYIDIYLDNPVLKTNFVLKKEVIFLLAKNDVQIELDIERGG